MHVFAKDFVHKKKGETCDGLAPSLIASLVARKIVVKVDEEADAAKKTDEAIKRAAAKIAEEAKGKTVKSSK